MTTQSTPALTTSTLQFKVVSTESVQLQPTQIYSSFIVINATWPSGNNPTTNTNNIFVWENDNSTDVPWGQAPVANVAVANENPTIPGSFGAHQYIVGYSDGPAVTSNSTTTYPNICATSAIPADWNLNNCVPQSSSLTPNTVQAGIVTVNYAFPAGFDPSGAGSWVAIYAGDIMPYGNSSILGYGAITSSTSSGMSFITNLNLAPKQTYTLALFNSGYNATQSSLVFTNIAAVTVFRTSTSVAEALR